MGERSNHQNPVGAARARATARVDGHRIVAEARNWLGVPWLHQGRSRLGLDCIGLVLVVCWRLRFTDYDVRGYGTEPDPEFMRAECDRMMTRIESPEAGSVILFRLSRRLLHAMICAGERRVIHAWAAAGRVVETGFPASWAHRVESIYRVPGVV